MRTEVQTGIVRFIQGRERKKGERNHIKSIWRQNGDKKIYGERERGFMKECL